MESVHRIRLRPGRESKLLAGHAWVYRNEVEGWPQMEEGQSPAIEPGDLADIHDAGGKFLARAYLNPRSTIVARILERARVPIDQEFFLARINQAQATRERLLGVHRLSPPEMTYRVVHGEGDALPGLIVDRYADAVAVQITTAGMERRRQLIYEAVDKIFRPRLIVARNDSPIREREGLPRERNLIRGELPAQTMVTINGLTVQVDLWEGQKTGLFLDQVENYRLLQHISRDAHVLDCFCYVGLWSLHAARYGAASVIGIDQSPPAIDRAMTAAQQNGFAQTCRFQVGNVFDELRERDRRREAFDIIILDPPAFVKSRERLTEALRGYKEINLRAMRLLRPGGFLVTSSCSHHLSTEQFRELLWESAGDIRRSVRLLAHRGQHCDHPIVLGMPETEYLKCFLLHVM
jgi:23S rRNA (cytosine1962-C5)-methyltransferase